MELRDASRLAEASAHVAAGEAVYFTVHHPERPGQGITVYYGNSEQALANAPAASGAQAERPGHIEARK